MAFQGFGKSSGPSAPPRAQTPFGHFPRPPSPTPPFPATPLQQSPRQVQAPERTPSPSLAFRSHNSARSPSYPSTPLLRPTEFHPQTSSGQKPFPSSYDAQTQQRPSAVTSFLPSQNSGACFLAKDGPLEDLKRTRSPPLLSTNEVNANSTRSGFVRPLETFYNDQRQSVPLRVRLPPAFRENNHSVENFGPSVEAQRPALSPPVWGNQSRPQANYGNSWIRQVQSVDLPNGSRQTFSTKHVDAQIQKRIRPPDLSYTNEVPRESSRFNQKNSERLSQSPPRLGSRSNNISTLPNSQNLYVPLPSSEGYDDKAAAPKAAHLSAPKRTRSPTLPSTDQVFHEKPSAQDDTERDLEAKAKRLARFNVELSQPVQSFSDIENQKLSMNIHSQSLSTRRKLGMEHSTDKERDISNGNALSDYEAVESSTVIIGLCPDMCPESERAERERKGDLDQYERLDGDRNQTTKSLAVKKYNRTAEREADLIRPMPILQMTINYLLTLLDQPYDENFLGLYNFLWDRMRAVRMDLRMQHIFNLDAIKMLEQMIRLHIIAMHELCEYTKGEGFSEGFDAHLNIEQMNKTSVELFQLYDDHRKKGIQVPTEKEFRGYYALLKLDKHPGYKVDPAEFSLELSKMTPKIRQTQEVLFAREVARACRTGNFVAFFRLARKATYLQACLMHAHFAKLRTQALASLQCGLQNNQGIPVAHVAKWLAMEEEDIESLLEYHGFLIKEFEEPYMVKEGPFLNIDNDYPVKCSKLVHLKKSQMIVEDVSSPRLTVSSPGEEMREVQLVKAQEQESKHVPLVEPESKSQAFDEEMTDYEVVPSPKQVKPLGKAFVNPSSGDGNQMTTFPFLCDFSPAHSSPKSQLPRVGSLGKRGYNSVFRNSFGRNTLSDTQAIPSHTISGGVGSLDKQSYDTVSWNTLERNVHSDTQAIPSQTVSGVDPAEFASSGIDSALANLVPQRELIEDIEDEEHADDHQHVEAEEFELSYQDEVAEAKLKLIFRLWKHRAMRRRELREKRQLAAMAALNSLSLGPPIRQLVDQPSTSGDFNIDHIMNERYERHERSWSTLNVSDVIAGTLAGRSPATKCFCWKLILCTQIDDPDCNNLQQAEQGAQFSAGPWLLSKLMPIRKDDAEDDELLITSPGLSIWKKWVPDQSGGDLTCCLSIIRDAKHDDRKELVLGASAVLFLVSPSISLEIQKLRLHNLLKSLPSGSSLPLLIIVDSYEENSDSSTVVAGKLGLHDIDKSRVGKCFVVFLTKDQQLEDPDGFFSDEQLRVGLQWLASESPLQPVVCSVRTRELVYTHLISSLEALDQMGIHQVSTDHCISAFNEALHQAAKKVASAAEANPNSWPCPEISLLDKSSYEYEVVKLYLPDTGWSSLEKIEPLICTLRDTELPYFEDDISFLHRGSYLGQDIENQKLELENCLIRYLSHSSKMMGLSLATNEAHVMLQKGAVLELRNSTYYIVPKWVMIFRRVFNWRLMGLSDGASCRAYVLEGHGSESSNLGGEKLGIQGYFPSPCTDPSLDEMMEAGCGSLSFYKSLQSLPTTVANNGEAAQDRSADYTVKGNINFDEDANTGDGSTESNRVLGMAAAALKEADKLSKSNINFDEDANTGNRSSERSRVLGMEAAATKETDKLSKLLEQCDVLQDIIDKKLSIYF
ncbi:hypothetical protein NMG60_11025212 [Bertholletia excelsa]